GAGVLRQETARACAQRLHDGAVVAVRREDDDVRLRSALADATRRLDAVAARHAEVHQDDLGAQPFDERDRLLAVGGAADDLEVGQQPEQRREPLAHDTLVVGEDDGRHAGTHSSTRNPAPVAPAESVPPSSSARSRIPVSPYPASFAAGTSCPTASTLRRVPPSSYTRQSSTWSHDACFWTFVSASCA